MTWTVLRPQNIHHRKVRTPYDRRPDFPGISCHIPLLAEDVLHARLKTVGVSEYKFEMEASAGRDAGTEWRIIDVGGSRSQVQLASLLNAAG